MNDKYLAYMEDAVAESNKGIIYLYTFDNGKQYVGQTIISVKKRYGQHLAEDNALSRAMKTHKHMVSILEVVDIEKLDDAEIKWIAEKNTLWPRGYNFTTGGSSPRISEESRKKISQKMMGKNNHRFGMCGKYSSVSKPVYQYSKDGKFLKEYESMSLAQESTGIPFKSISACCTRKPDKNGYITKSAGGYMWKYADGDTSDIEPISYNYTKNVEHMVAVRRKSIIATHIFTGEETEYPSACEAQRQTGINQANISACLKGTRKKAGDYYWRLKE